MTRADWNKSDIKLNPEQYLSDGERIMADGGFIGGHPLIVPIIKTVLDNKQNEEVRQDMEECNGELTANRVLVEDVFGWLKAKAKRLGHRYGREKQHQGEEFRAACCVYNFVRFKRIQHAAHLPAS